MAVQASASKGPVEGRPTLSLAMIAAFVAVDLLLVGACLFALRQNVKLRTERAEYEALLTPEKGSSMPALVGQDWKGVPQTVTYGQDPRPTLVYTFTTECPSCRQNWRAMRSFQALAPGRLRIIYIDTHDVFAPQYLAENRIGQSVLLVRLSQQAAIAYDARAFPQLLLVDHEGRMQWSHVGELSPADIAKALPLVEHDVGGASP